MLRNPLFEINNDKILTWHEYFDVEITTESGKMYKVQQLRREDIELKEFLIRFQLELHKVKKHLYAGFRQLRSHAIQYKGDETGILENGVVVSSDFSPNLKFLDYRCQTDKQYRHSTEGGLENYCVRFRASDTNSPDETSGVVDYCLHVLSDDPKHDAHLHARNFHRNFFYWF